MNNTAGASMGPYRGLKGSQRSKNGYNLDFTDFLNTFATIWVSGLAIVSSIQIIEQLEKNDFGAPTGLFRGPKGPKEAEMAIIFIFPISWIIFRQIGSVAWQWSLKKNKLMQIIKKSMNNAAGAPTGPYRGLKGSQRSKNGYNLDFPDLLNTFATIWVSGLAMVSYER